MCEVQAEAFRKQGAIFQLPMIPFWLWRGWMFIPDNDDGKLFTLPLIIDLCGFALMAVALFRIYFLNKEKRLLTSDMFAVTRHPMYHGMFLVDFALFFYPANLSNPLFWVTWIVFVFLLFMAGWYQEKETLARWGAEAESYYARTPRFIFGWLWR